MAIERFIAFRYLRPRRGRGLISVVTSIAVIGFAAGVAALILALAVANGFQDTLQQELVGITADLNLLRKDAYTIPNYRELIGKLQKLPHVRALAPVFYTEALITHARSAEAVVKGVIPDQELRVSGALNRITQGSWRELQDDPSARVVVLGKDLADSLGATVGDHVQLYVPNAILTPLGYAGRTSDFRIVGIFQSGFSDIDSRWAFTSLTAAQRLTSDNTSGDRASAIEFRIDDIYAADQVATEAEQTAGSDYAATTWMAQNRALFRALKLERLGTVIVIGLVVFVAAMNVLIMLTMLVMEKRKEIAVLISMGAKRRQIRRIFVLQGILIDLIGTAVGLTVAYALAWGANRHHWIPLSAEVYPINYVPFHAHAADGVLVAVLALAVSYLATLYPSKRAVQVSPAETLRYE